MLGDAPVTFRRKTQRRIFRESGLDTAAKMIGAVADGDEICGITNGQYSLVDIIEHLLSQTGPADISVATWTMGIYDAERAYRFVSDARIRSIRFILDPSMFTRRPELASVLVKGFGAGAFRAVNSHAKFATIRGDRLAVVVRSSMNLNENRRIESFDISADDAMTAFFEGLVSRIWDGVSEENRSQSAAVFSGLLDAKSVKNPRRRNPWLDSST
jgi:hypothetical protein